jgi:PAS domain S-box-containing protein
MHVNFCIDRGGIGGSYPDFADHTIKAGDLAARILSGEKPENIPLLHDSGTRPYIDWRQLRRWNIPESALPPGSVVLYRGPTTWEQYKWLIIGAVALIIVLAPLIIGLVSHRARRKKVEASLRESEERFRLMADAAPTLIWMSDKDGKYTYLNEKWREFTGREPSTGLGDGYKAYVQPEDLDRVVKAVSSGPCNGKFTHEYRLKAYNGDYLWLLDIAVPRIFADGSFAGFIGAATDITEQKLAHEALAKVSGQLIEVQEKERTRIARELHDDICQRLTLLSIQLDRSSTPAEPKPAQPERRSSELKRLGQLREAARSCSEIAYSVQALSHELHSSNLDYLGLAPAVTGFCREFSEQHRVVVNFTTAGLPNSLPGDVSLCIFRVLQEALRNALKHSGASCFEVSLRGATDAVDLEISDRGVGFDVGSVQAKGGLGLVSMRERVQLVKGIISIKSQPNCGTKIALRIPVAMDVPAKTA